jgi:hypothetical protein
LTLHPFPKHKDVLECVESRCFDHWSMPSIKKLHRLRLHRQPNSDLLLIIFLPPHSRCDMGGQSAKQITSGYSRFSVNSHSSSNLITTKKYTDLSEAQPHYQKKYSDLKVQESLPSNTNLKSLNQGSPGVQTDSCQRVEWSDRKCRLHLSFHIT